MLPAPPRTPDAVGVGRFGASPPEGFSSGRGGGGPGTTPVCCGMDGQCLCYLKPLCGSWRARSPALGLATTTTSARNRYRRHGNTRNTFPAKISVHEQRGKGELATLNLAFSPFLFSLLIIRFSRKKIEQYWGGGGAGASFMATEAEVAGYNARLSLQNLYFGRLLPWPITISVSKDLVIFYLFIFFFHFYLRHYSLSQFSQF